MYELIDKNGKILATSNKVMDLYKIAKENMKKQVYPELRKINLN